MPIKSRLHERRAKVEVDIINQTLTSGRHVESVIYPGLEPGHEQVDAFMQAGDGGAMVAQTDVFWFKPLSNGSLPAITEHHVIQRLSDDKKFQIIAVKTLNQMKRLKVTCRSLG